MTKKPQTSNYAPLELRKALSNYLNEKIELKDYADKDNGIGDSYYNLRNGNFLNKYIEDLYGNNVLVRINSAGDYQFANNDFLFLTRLQEFVNMKAVMDANYIPILDDYPFLDKEQTLKELQAIKRKEPVNITSKDLLIIDANHPQDPPLASFLLVSSLLNTLATDIYFKYDWARDIKDDIASLKKHFNKIYKEHKEKETLKQLLSEEKNNILIDFFADIKKAQDYIQETIYFIDFIKQYADLKNY